MKYLAVEANTMDELNRKVNEKIEEGWDLQGGISICIYQITKKTQYISLVEYFNRRRYSQAMILDNQE